MQMVVQVQVDRVLIFQLQGRSHLELVLLKMVEQEIHLLLVLLKEVMVELVTDLMELAIMVQAEEVVQVPLEEVLLQGLYMLLLVEMVYQYLLH
tara:strand:- start:210 stop:491 length:282 start_codon:yes stop_codon:yes gene_type:complete